MDKQITFVGTAISLTLTVVLFGLFLSLLYVALFASVDEMIRLEYGISTIPEVSTLIILFGSCGSLFILEKKLIQKFAEKLFSSKEGK